MPCIVCQKEKPFAFEKTDFCSIACWEKDFQNRNFGLPWNERESKVVETKGDENYNKNYYLLHKKDWKKYYKYKKKEEVFRVNRKNFELLKEGKRKGRKGTDT